MEADLRGRRSCAHGGAVVRADLRASERIREHVERDIVRIRPNADLRIIGELAAAVVKRVTVICPGRVGCRRYSDTL